MQSLKLTIIRTMNVLVPMTEKECEEARDHHSCVDRCLWGFNCHPFKPKRDTLKESICGFLDHEWKK